MSRSFEVSLTPEEIRDYPPGCACCFERWRKNRRVKIPSATEAAERSPEPAQTTPAKDSG
jgi:hypothetical protein